MFKKLLVVVLLTTFCTRVILAQTEDTPENWQFIRVENTRDLGDSRSMTVSPDASMLAYTSPDGLCLHVFRRSLFIREQTTCYTMPENLRLGRSLLYWSPDSRYIAFHENFIQYFLDSDIWLFDVEAREYIHLTDDNYYDDAISNDGIPIDILPVWDPTDGDLYFFRSYRNEQVGWTLALMQASREGGVLNEPVQLYNLTAFQPAALTFYDTDPIALSGAAAISPDGKTMALLSRPREREQFAVFLLDMETGELDNLVYASSFTGMGLPEWKPADAYFLESLGWSNGGNGLVVTTYDPLYASQGITSMAYYLDLEGNVTPLFDFTTIPDSPSFYNEQPEDGFAARYDVPISSAISPDGALFLYFNGDRMTGQAGISALRLPPDGAEPIRLAFMDEYVPVPFMRTSIGTDGETLRIIVFGHLFTFTL